mmetsp:Transcript_94967/g.245295  ORF Transcript_94967/g.245295 Transcript_94967/m.245295 type:complete len:249 (-) Transcript_94967:701-1447(-)
MLRKSSRLNTSCPFFSKSAIAARYSLPRPTARLTFISQLSTSCRDICACPAEHRASNADPTAASSSLVGVPSSCSILLSMLDARIVGGVLSTPNVLSAASAKRARPCFRTLVVICTSSWPFSVGSPDSRKSGPTSPRRRNSRTAVLPCEFRSPQKTAGTARESKPSFLHSLATASSASCTCRSRRSALCPAERCAFARKRLAPGLAPLRCRAVTSTRSWCFAEASSQREARQKVAGRMRPFFSCSSAS